MALIWIYVLWFNLFMIMTTKSMSACGGVDILCFIDSATIKNSADEIKQFIDDLVLKGSNEETSLSIIVYGNIPTKKFKKGRDIILVKSDETLNIRKGRKRKQKLIGNKLDFSSFLNNKRDTKFVSLTDAVNIVLNNGNKPTNDDSETQKEIIIFEYDEHIVSNQENCGLVEDYSDHIHFIIDDIYNQKDNFANCINMDKTKQANLTYYFSEIIENMEIIYDFSCPTNMQIEDDNGGNIGSLSLNKHTNYINLDAIINCNLDYDDDGQLTENSNIYVIDDLEDDMTFEINEYLIVKKKDYEYLPSDCKYPVFKINNIEYDAVTTNVLKLYVTTPPLFEYIPELHVKAPKVKMQRMHYKKKGNYKRKRRQEHKTENRRILLEEHETLQAENGETWGEWDSSINVCDGAPAYCFNLKVDPDGATGANAVRLLCANGNIDKRSNDGPYGEYMHQTICCPQNNDDGILDNFLSGFRQRVEEAQGWWYDDSAVNDVQFMCSDGTVLTSTNGATEGTWSYWQQCSANKYISSFNQLVEPDAGISDDTGLNDLKFYCYEKDPEATYYGSSDVNGGMFDVEEPTELINIDTGLVEYSITLGGQSNAIDDYGKKSTLKIVGQVTVNFGFELEFSLSADLDFDYSFSIWDGFTVNEIRVVFYGDYSVFAKFGMDIEGWLQLTIPSLFQFEQITVLWLTFVPVIVTPYIGIDLVFTTPKIGIKFNAEYQYNSNGFSFGMVYDSNNGGWDTINSFPNNEQTSTFTTELIGDFQPDLCDININLDGAIKVFIGAKFYEVLKAFLLVNLGSNNILTVPTTCNSGHGVDICNEDILKATVSTKETISISVGVGITFDSEIFSVISQYLSGGYLIAPIPDLTGIIIYENQWCFTLDGILYPIHLFFQSLCCSNAADSKLNSLSIGYNDEYDNNINNIGDLIKNNKYFISSLIIIFIIFSINLIWFATSFCNKKNPTVKYLKV